MSPSSSPPEALATHERETVMRVLAAASFFIIFQAYLLAPLIPALTLEFHSTTQFVGLAVPAYMIPYGLSTLFYGPLSDRAGRKKILLALLLILAIATACMASAQSVTQILLWRILAGIASGGIIPIALALLGDLFPYAERGRPIGWIFGAIAGGMAFGSTCGAILNPLIGWRTTSLLVGCAMAIIFLLAFKHRRLLAGNRSDNPPHLGVILKDYATLLISPRGSRTYIYVFLNAVFHSGIFSWLGLYFAQRYHLSDLGIGLALLGYGIPGMLLGPIIGSVVDRLGRKSIIPAGVLLAALSALLLIPAFPLLVPAIMVTLLSFGYDMSHPLFAGIITSLDPARRGQALALNAFFLFTGFGIGSLLFQQLLRPPFSFSWALGVFGTLQVLAGLLAIKLFRSERASTIGH